MTGNPYYRPQDFGTIFSNTFSVYGRGLRSLIPAGLLTIVPGVILGVAVAPFITRFQDAARLQDQGAMRDIVTSSGFLATLGIALLVVLLLAPITYAIVLATALDVVQSPPGSLGRAFSATLRRYLPIAGLLAIVWVVIFLLAITCIGIPFAIWIGVAWTVALPALFMEDLGPMRALRRSWQLVHHNWWRTFGLVIVFSIGVSFASSFIGRLLGIAALAIPDETTRTVVQQVLTALVSAVLGPLTSVLIALLYFELRARHEMGPPPSAYSYAAPGSYPGTYQPPYSHGVPPAQYPPQPPPYVPPPPGSPPGSPPGT